MERVTLKAVYRDDVVTKFGPGVRTKIVTKEYPDVKMSSFSKGLEVWKEGDVVEITITRNGEYTNFKPGEGVSRGFGRDSNLEGRVAKIEQHLWPKEEVVEADQQDFDDF